MQVKRKFNYMNLLLVLVFGLGLGILLYPNISNFINERNSSKATAEYDETVAQMNEEQRKELMVAANDYNKSLINNPIGRFSDMTKEALEEYMSLLNVDGSGMMCYLKIDKLGVNLPIYHSTEEAVLQHYVGHVEGTSLPVGGLGTHCALSGHRGLPSAVLFTNLDRMEVGDTFTIIVLGEEHLYVVDQITTVLPNDMTQLEIDPEKDFCTLITCTPYGVNTHRLMVRGVRVPDEQKEEIIGESGNEKIHFTREQIVNIIAGAMTTVFAGFLIPILLFPVVPKKVIALRPWDDNIVKVFDSAISVSEHATRANWAMDDITKEADILSSMRRWDDTLRNKKPLSEEDLERPWNDYDYEDDTPISKTEQKKYREWDDRVLEKVDQDWSPLDGDAHKEAMRYREIKEIIERGEVDTPEEDKKVYYAKELKKGKEILKKSKRKEDY